MKESSMPSMCAGVYRSHAKGDKAFEPISLEDLNSVLDTGCVDDKLSNVYIGRRNSMVRRLSIDSRASTAWLVMNNPALVETHDQNEDIDEEETSRPGTPTSKPRASVLLPPPSNVVNRRRCTSELEHRLIVSRLSTDLTSLTIRKWRQQKQISDSPLRTFAKDEMHFNLLEKLSDKIAVSVPMPLVIEICKEAYPIIAETVVTYERYLGKNNSMTKESAARFKEIQEMHDMYNNI
ncbi:hypothetical protein LSAT2_014690 [Lamellibrachia satsuma]|nr:hypothetical protein LSAT2_014690 [Lamellibrachia satsuma]